MFAFDIKLYNNEKSISYEKNLVKIMKMQNEFKE